MLEEVARQLAEVGIRVEVNALPKERWFALLGAGKSKFYLFGWACESRDAGDILDGMLHTPTPGWLGSNNYQGLSDPELDRLIAAAEGESDPVVRYQSLARAMARVKELHALLPLTIQTETVAMSASVDWSPPLNFGLRLFAR
jgi:peptide/nickel transport system substrate-binding protein